MKKVISILICLVTVMSLFSSVLLANALGEEKGLAYGIDVSAWQENIDWNKVRQSGKSFAILRAAHGKTKDRYFEQNYTNAKAAGMNLGCYVYSEATTVEEAQDDANALLGWLKGKKLEYPVYYDMESSLQLSLTTAKRTEIAMAFAKIMKDNGYLTGVYANRNWFWNYLDLEALRKDGETWIAHYLNTKYDYSNDFRLYQYSCTGSVDGINGDVDLDVAYFDYPEYVKTCGYNGYVSYIEDAPMGETLCYKAGIWHYVVDRKVVFDKETLVNYYGTWYYVKNGEVDWNCNTIVNYYGTWYYVKNGQVCWNGETLVDYYGIKYYVKNGVVDWKSNTLIKYNGVWYYAENGTVPEYGETLVNYYGTWYYVQDGQVCWNGETLVNYYGTWYYVKNGVVDWKSDTLVNYYGTWYYAKNGQVCWNGETLVNYYGTWYYVKNGSVDWKNSTLVNYYGTWYYVKNGQVDWNSKTLVDYYGTKYYVEKGSVNFKANLKFVYLNKTYTVKNGIAK